MTGFNAEYLRQVAKGRRRLSAESAIRIERATHGAIRREDLRPDIFGQLRGENDQGAA